MASRATVMPSTSTDVEDEREGILCIPTGPTHPKECLLFMPGIAATMVKDTQDSQYYNSMILHEIVRGKVRHKPTGKVGFIVNAYQDGLPTDGFALLPEQLEHLREVIKEMESRAREHVQVQVKNVQEMQKHLERVCEHNYYLNVTLTRTEFTSASLVEFVRDVESCCTLAGCTNRAHGDFRCGGYSDLKYCCKEHRDLDSSPAGDHPCCLNYKPVPPPIGARTKR